jgi:hemerythrin HHE cation binding domain-containing protein
MNRFKIAEAPHKGLRNALSQLSFIAGSINFTDKGKVASLYELGKDIFMLLNGHANDENTIVLAELEKKVPGASKHDLNDHEEIEAIQSKLESDLESIYNRTMAGKDTTEAGAEFYQAFSRFHSRYLMHMDDEETVTVRMLWDNFTDDEIIAMRNTIISRFKPEVMMKWQQFILPALGPGQRAAMLGGVKATVPEHVFNSFMELCKKYLTEEDYNDLTKKLGIQ